MDWTRKIHKWASLIVGIQFLLWLVSGIYFNLMDHDKAGGHQYRAHMHQTVEVNKKELVEPSIILAKASPATSIKVINLLDEFYYLVNHEKGLYANFANRYSLYHAYTSERINIDDNFVRSLAEKSYNGPGEIVSVKYIEGKIDDFPKQKNPSWQVNFNDEVNTSVYIEAESGRIVGHSDDDKRLAGIFFMLHFMDYANEGSFNNIAIIVFAFITLWLSTTGLIWTVDLAMRGQYKIKWFATQRKVKLFDKNKTSLGEIKLSTHNNLLSELENQHIILPSSCGGGGTCGKCRVLISPNAKVTSADAQQFDEAQLGEGYRLACQHFANDVEGMTLMDVTDAKKITLQLTSSEFLSADIKELKFNVIGDSFDFKAGAFMRFLIPEGKGNTRPENIPADYQTLWQEIENKEYQFESCSRSYSIANACKSNEEVTFTIKLLKAKNSQVPPGVGSNFLGNMAVNQCIEALGPFEDFYVTPNKHSSIVLVGAGSGMAPLKAILEEQLDNEYCENIVFIYGARSEQDLIYQDELSELSRSNKKFTYIPTLSRPEKEWLGAQGYAQNVLEMNLSSLGDITKTGFYLCGPQGMMDETIALLKTHGIENSNISFDDFS